MSWVFERYTRQELERLCATQQRALSLIAAEVDDGQWFGWRKRVRMILQEEQRVLGHIKMDLLNREQEKLHQEGESL